MKKSYQVLRSLVMIMILLPSTKSSAQCIATGSLFQQSFTGFTIQNLGNGLSNNNFGCQPNNGSITLSGSACNFNSVRGTVIDRAWKQVPTLSAANWTADFTLTITTPIGATPSYFPAVHLLIFSANNLALNTNTAGMCNGYVGTENNNSAIWVDLVSNGPPNCPTIDPNGQSQTLGGWVFNAHSRLNNGTTANSANINCTGISTYYIRLQRTQANTGALYVYSDATFSTLVGSACFPIDPNIPALSYEQHAVMDKGSCNRCFCGRVSHLWVDNTVTCPAELNPTITMNNIVCCGSPIVATGSAGSNPGPVTNHIWTITETNSSCVPIFPTNSFTTGWVVGVPGTYDFTNSILTCGSQCSNHVQCGHYYRIDLAVQNCGDPWEITSKCIYINPAIIVNPGNNGSYCCSTGSLQIGGNPTAQGGTPPYTYAWSFSTSIPNNGNLLNATSANPTYTWTPAICANATFTVTVIDANGCQASATLALTGNGACRVANPNQTDIPSSSIMSIAPNPTNGNVTVSFLNAGIAHDIEVVDVIGRVVYRQTEISDATLPIDLSDQPKGVYFVKCKEGDQIFVQRIVLQ